MKKGHLRIFFVLICSISFASCLNQTNSNQENPQVIDISPTPEIQTTIYPEATIEFDLTKFRDDIKFNPDCNFPCWLDIHTSQTTIEDATEILQEYDIEIRKDDAYVSSENLELWSSSFNYVEAPKILVLNTISFFVDNDIIRWIKIESSKSGTGEFPLIWSSYHLDEVIRNYGAPTKFYIDFNLESFEDKYVYYIWIVYDELRTMIMYQGSMETTRDGLCLPTGIYANDVDNFSIMIADERDSISLEHIFQSVYGHKFPDNQQGRLTEFFDYSAEEIYKMISANELICNNEITE